MFRHAALNVKDLPTNRAFYERVFGLKPYHVEDTDWLMLDREGSTLSLVSNHPHHPAHLGFVLSTCEEVDALYARIVKEAPESKPTRPKLHRDESYGFYLFDPSGNALECIFIPARASKSGTQSKTSAFLILLPRALSEELTQEILQNASLHLRGAPVHIAPVKDASVGLEALRALPSGPEISSLVVVPWVMAMDREFSRELEQGVRELRAQEPSLMIEVIEPLGRHSVIQNSAWAVLADWSR